jgi:uroporphyrinogen decarboxylase
MNDRNKRALPVKSDLTLQGPVDTGMTPRERALAAFRHEVPDIVPAYVRDNMDWRKLAAYFNLSTEEELFAFLGNTIKTFYPACLIEPEDTPDSGSELTIWGVSDEKGGTYSDLIPRPLANAETVADVEAFNWPSGNEWDFRGMRHELEKEKTYARLSPSWLPVFSRLCEMFGMEKAMVSLYTNRPIIEAALAHLDEFYTDFFRNILDECGDHLDIFGMGDDFAGNAGMLISPDLWRELFKPLYAKWFGMAKDKGLFTFMHCCGKLTDVLPELIDIGLDAWQTVQTHLTGQSAEFLKKEFGAHLTFIGAIDTSNIMSFASPEEVRKHVQTQISALGKGGGYICAPDHTIMPEVSSENVEALYSACREFRAECYTTCV